MIITKSHFIEWIQNPIIARRRHNDTNVYQQIKQHKHRKINYTFLTQQVDQLLNQQLKKHNISHRETIEISSLETDTPARYQAYADETLRLIHLNTPAIKQPGFFIDDIFLIADLLVKNESDTYDIRKIKSKKNIYQGDNDLQHDIRRDISLQSMLISQAIDTLFSQKITIFYLNKDYILQPTDHDTTAILRSKTITPIVPIQTPVDIFADEVPPPKQHIIHPHDIHHQIQIMKQQIQQDQATFHDTHPYNNEDQLTYFGKKSQADSIRHIAGGRSYRKQLMSHGYHHIMDIPTSYIQTMTNKKGEPSLAARHIQHYQSATEYIDHQAIQSRLDTGLRYPIYFYDYETVSTAIPLIHHTKPRQQTVVQYSIHRLDQDGTITHHQNIIKPNEQTIDRIIDQLIIDLDAGNGSYVVRYQGFENTRNSELMELFPQHQQALQKINDNTFDLMKIFSDLLYVHHDFAGSSSIKNVLPVITDVSYSDLTIKDGAQATQVLNQVILNKGTDIQIKQHITDLLAYCQRDTRAMVKIYQTILQKIATNSKKLTN